MQCLSYFPVYNSHYDLNVDASGGTSPMYNGNGAFQSGHYNNYVPSLAVPQAPFAYKELLRRRILMHEVTFRDQVQELHRLYRRQKELMCEIKNKELYTNHLHLDVQISNSSPEKFLSRCGPNTLDTLPFVNSHCRPSSTATDNIQTDLNSINEQKAPVGPVTSQNDGVLNNLHFPESKAKRIGRKFLDLELPAEVYADSDEGESFGDLQVSEAPSSANLHANKLSNVVIETDAMTTSPNRWSDPIFQGELPTPCLKILNEPPTTSCLGMSNRIPGNEATNSIPTATSDRFADKLAMKTLDQFSEVKSKAGAVSYRRKPFYDLGQNSIVVQALPSFRNPLPSSKDAKMGGKSKGSVNKKIDASLRYIPSFGMKSLHSSSSESKLKESVICMSSTASDQSKHLNGLNCIDLNSALVANTELTTPSDSSSSKTFTESENTRKSKRCRLLDINLPCDPTMDEEPLIDNFKSSGPINLNLCVNDDDLPAPKSSSSERIPLEIDLEAPVSPEVEERPPPRGDSEENKSEVGDPLVELAKIAAEAIVSMSPSKSSQDFQKCEPSDNRCLEWFAGLVFSFSSALENGIEALKNTTCIDEFEVMTLELTEMKEQEHWCKSSVQIPIEACSMPFNYQTRKGRTRRSKRKDFQREVLPSLACLSRHEVTEDIQMIEGLLEAAGTPLHLSRTRRACRMARKLQVAKQRISASSDLPELKAEALVSWGKVNRRTRGRRSPASPSAVLSKWLEYAI